MEEFDPYLSYTPEDRLTPAEYVARNRALHALIEEAVEAQDLDKKSLYEIALGDLNNDNPGEGKYHKIDACPDISPTSLKPSRRMVEGMKLFRHRS